MFEIPPGKKFMHRLKSPSGNNNSSVIIPSDVVYNIVSKHAITCIMIYNLVARLELGASYQKGHLRIA